MTDPFPTKPDPALVDACLAALRKSMLEGIGFSHTTTRPNIQCGQREEVNGVVWEEFRPGGRVTHTITVDLPYPPESAP